MLIDWLAREGWIVFNWWALVTLAGAAALPLCVRLLGALPDRGWTLARPAGMLVVGFVFWLLASFGFLRNTPGSMVFAWLLVLVGGLLAFASGPRIDLRAWWRENRAAVIVGEVLFIVLLLGWAVVRAHQNNLTGTEKPMELAFISATMRSETFPPNDPWLSGYAISYYYFGYVMAAMLSTLSGITSGVGFNMMVALLFALTGLTAFGVVYNLVRSRAVATTRADLPVPTVPPLPDESDEPTSGFSALSRAANSARAAVLSGLLGTVFVVLLGNFQMPLVEIPYQSGTATADYLQFWDVNARQQPREFGATSDPAGWEFWWWFRGARVLNDRNLDGSREEVIDEFPQFSYLLGDVHPHVLALPFAAFAIGLAFNIVLTRRAPNRLETGFYALTIGGLIFLNTWDGAIYLFVLVGAEGLRRIMYGGTGRLSFTDLIEMAIFGGILIGVGALLYLPFLVGFRSQLGGILPNIVHPTWFPQFFLMFGPLLVILALYLVVEVWRAGGRRNLALGVWSGFLVLVVLAGLMLALTFIGAIIPELRSNAWNYVEANGGWGVVLPQILTKRLTHGLTALLLALGVALIVARLFPHDMRGLDDETDGRYIVTYPPATGFALLIAAAAIMLVLVPEFVYLRDNFGTRMNTVFKFYYQVWLMAALASAYAVYSLLADSGAVVKLRMPALPVRLGMAALFVVCIGAGLLYPLLGVQNRMLFETGRANNPEARALTLDGGPSSASPDDYAAVMCLGGLLQGDEYVVAEAVGGSYDSENPPSGLTGRLLGIPVVYNWPGHQGQWRGPTTAEAVGTRGEDMDALYGGSWAMALDVINRYGIDFIFFGTGERQKYGREADLKFRDNLEIVCESGSTRIYRVDERIFALR